jgi:hypothetical protein
MTCINADGSLTPIAKKVLAAMHSPATPPAIAQSAEAPLYRASASLRELSDLGLVKEADGYLQITEAVEKRLA